MRIMLEYEIFCVYVLVLQRNKVVILKEIFQDYWDKVLLFRIMKLVLYINLKVLIIQSFVF